MDNERPTPSVLGCVALWCVYICSKMIIHEYSVLGDLYYGNIKGHMRIQIVLCHCVHLAVLQCGKTRRPDTWY